MLSPITSLIQVLCSESVTSLSVEGQDEDAGSMFLRGKKAFPRVAGWSSTTTAKVVLNSSRGAMRRHKCLASKPELLFQWKKQNGLQYISLSLRLTTQEILTTENWNRRSLANNFKWENIWFLHFKATSRQLATASSFSPFPIFQGFCFFHFFRMC